MQNVLRNVVLRAPLRRAVAMPTPTASSRALMRPITTQAMKINAPLKEADPEIYNIVEMEKDRQRKNVVLIASENFAPQAVLDAVGSVMTNKYSEGYPGARYYGGNEFIDMAEDLCRKR